MNITETQLNTLLDSLCSIANLSSRTKIKMINQVTKDAFNSLDRGDGKNDFVFQCESCDQWFLREHFGKHGECFDCINQ